MRHYLSHSKNMSTNLNLWGAIYVSMYDNKTSRSVDKAPGDNTDNCAEWDVGTTKLFVKALSNSSRFHKRNPKKAILFRFIHCWSPCRRCDYRSRHLIPLWTAKLVSQPTVQKFYIFSAILTNKLYRNIDENL